MRKIKILNFVFIWILFSLNPAFSQNTECIRTKINPIGVPIQLPVSLGSTNNDKTYESVDQFVDLDISTSSNANSLSACVYKNNAARIVNFDPVGGSLKLVEDLALTDLVKQGLQAAVRTICTFSPNGSQLFFSGNGPQEFGSDRIYSYKTNPTLMRVQKNGKNDFFAPSDLTTSVAITPNGKYLVYLQGNTANNNLASLQAVEIKSDFTLGEYSKGQEYSRAVEAGSYLEYAKSEGTSSAKFVYGVFSNIQQGKSGSGTGLAIIRTEQQQGTNVILSEFKKGNAKSPLSQVFNTSTFVGFSGFKFIEHNGELFLFVSYFENDPNAGYPNFSYVTKLAVLKVIPEQGKNTATIELIATPISTVFKSCSSNEYHGINGPIQVVDNVLYIADNNSDKAFSKNENYFATYSIDWNLLQSTNPSGSIIQLASVPLKTIVNAQERNTDVVVNSGNKFVYVATSDTKEPNSAKIFGYLIESSKVQCSSLINELAKSDVCQDDNDIKLVLDSGSKISSKNSTIDSDKGSEGLVNKPADQGGSLPDNQIQQATTNTFNNTKPTNLQPSNALPSSSSTQPLSNNLPQAYNPQPFVNNSGRPPEFGNSGRPPEFGSNSVSNPQPIGAKKPTKLGLPKVIKSATSKLQISPNLGQIQKAELPSQVNNVAQSSSASIKEQQIAPSLDLSGADQIIVVPRVSLFDFKKVFKYEETEGNLIGSSSGNSENLLEPQLKGKIQGSPVFQSYEIRGLIKDSFVAILVNLKQDIKLKAKDLKDINYTFIGSDNNTVTVKGDTTLTVANKLLVKLSIPNTVPAGNATLLAVQNKKGNKKIVIAKSRLVILSPLDFENIGGDIKSGKEAPSILKIQGRVAGTSVNREKIIRLTITGNNFASNTINVKGRKFISKAYNPHTYLSFLDESDIRILRVRVLNKGTKMLVTLRFRGDELENKPFVISTPKGYLFKERMDIKLFSNKPVRSIDFKTVKQAN